MLNSDAPRVLIVDDNPYNRELISGVAEAEGFAVQEAQNGYQALEMLRKTDFALVMMDLLMPGMDGFETTRKIREMGMDVTVIAVTALTMKQDRQESIRAGCDEFLSKPLDIGELKSLLLKYTAAGPQKENNRVTAATEESYTESSFGFENLFLVLVEEDWEQREKESDFLVRAGFEVKAFPNGADAVDFIEQSDKSVHIVVSNIFTTGIDGLGLLTILKRKFPGILVFLYTESYDASTFQYAVQQKVDGMIPKDQFETTAVGMIRSALSQSVEKGSRTSEASAAEQVREAQKRLIHPGCMNMCPLLDVAYQSLHEAGGDLMQCRRFGTDGECGIIIADVAGHSVMSSYTSAIFTGLLMSVWELHKDPAELLKTMDKELLKVGNDKSHICATALLWDRWSGKFSFSCAGNPGGLIVRVSPESDVRFDNLAGGGMVLGALEDHDLFVSGRGTLQPDEYLFLFSDGIDPSELVRAIEKRPQIFKGSGTTGLCRQLMDTMLEENRPADDMILVCMHNNSPALGKGEFISSYASTYEEVDRACQWMEAKLAQSDPPEGIDKDFILLSAREALLNAVEHGNDRNPSARFEAGLYVKEDELKITITDEGKGFDLHENLLDPEDLTLKQVGKRGLSFAHSAAQQILVEKGAVTMIFKAKPDRKEE